MKISNNSQRRQGGFLNCISTAKLPEVMVGVFISKIADLFFGHPRLFKCPHLTRKILSVHAHID